MKRLCFSRGIQLYLCTRREEVCGLRQAAVTVREEQRMSPTSLGGPYSLHSYSFLSILKFYALAMRKVNWLLTFSTQQIQRSLPTACCLHDSLMLRVNPQLTFPSCWGSAPSIEHFLAARTAWTMWETLIRCSFRLCNLKRNERKHAKNQ